MSEVRAGSSRFESATDELRRLLDELGVEWEATADAPDSLTTWATGSDTARWCADELTNDRFDLYAYNVDEDVSGLTPAQAIDATLGRGTCEVIGFDDGMDEGLDGKWFAYAPPTWFLSCGHEGYGSERPHYCPNCGRRVV